MGRVGSRADGGGERKGLWWVRYRQWWLSLHQVRSATWLPAHHPRVAASLHQLVSGGCWASRRADGVCKGQQHASMGSGGGLVERFGTAASWPSLSFRAISRPMKPSRAWVCRLTADMSPKQRKAGAQQDASFVGVRKALSSCRCCNAPPSRLGKPLLAPQTD